MARFYTYETVDIPLVFTPTGILEGYSHIIVSIHQAGVKIDKTEDNLTIDVANDTITVSLSQEETGQFIGGENNNPQKAKIQVNIYYNNEKRDVSTVGYIDIYNNLYDKVIENE